MKLRILYKILFKKPYFKDMLGNLIQIIELIRVSINAVINKTIPPILRISNLHQTIISIYLNIV